MTTAKFTLPASRYPDNAAKTRFVDQTLARLRELPGVSSVGLTDAVPIADNRQGTSFVRLDAPAADPTASQNANVAWITEGYFETLGVPLVSGPHVHADDAIGRDRVVVINRMLARQVFGNDDPIGRLVRVGASTQAPFQVIGVVGDERHVGVDTEATPSMFLAYRQVPSVRDLSIVVRSAGLAGDAGIGVDVVAGSARRRLSRRDRRRRGRQHNQRRRCGVSIPSSRSFRSGRWGR